MNSNNSNGSGCVFVLFLAFIYTILKLTNVIDWNWGWVLSPIWIYALCTVAIIALMIFIGILIIIKNKIYPFPEWVDK